VEIEGMDPASLYPPSPPNVPADLTEPTSQYKTQLNLVLLAVALFFLFYFGILILCVVYFIWALGSLVLAPLHAGFALLACFQLALCVPVLVLFVFMAKNLIGIGRREQEDYLEIFQHEHPRLYEFIRRACDEIGAPYPNRVFVNHQVNAFAFNDGESFWHLFVPTGQNLMVGLGLVNSINLTEFKALLAHEFGHFSQRSSALRGYTYAALTITNRIVYGRDVVDRFIERLCATGNGFAVLGYVLYGIQWALRKAVACLHLAIFYLCSGLSQQNEFNADLFAVSVTGSDAPVHLLYRCSFAEDCLDQAVRDMETVRDHHLYTEDMFYHQSHAATFFRRRERKPNLGEPPALPADPTQKTTVFTPDDDEQADMWSSHPSNRDRERNAKAVYIRSEFDERSPWLLFDNVEQLRAEVTYKFYRMHLKARKGLVQVAAEEIQAFIDEERAETTYDAKYQGMYDLRDLCLSSSAIYELANEARSSPWSIDQLRTTHASLCNAEAKHRGQLFNTRVGERNLLLAVSNGWYRPTRDELEFRGEFYHTRDAKRLLRKVERELEEDAEWLADHDERVFVTYFQMALHLSQETAEDLLKRYRFHLDLQAIWRELREQEGPVGAAVAWMNEQSADRADPDYFDAVLSIFRAAHQALREALKSAEAMKIPPLANLHAGEPLRQFLLEKPLVERLTTYQVSLTSRWINKLVRQMGEVQKKVDRIHFKSVGGILALQERIAQECLQRWSQLPTTPVGPPK
jgi:Zn-dependent protease with chaperone function